MTSILNSTIVGSGGSLFLATILISSFALTACSNKSQTESSTKVITSSSSSQESSTSTTTSSDKKTEETQVIGSDEYGFVKVPKSWIKFNEVQGGNDIQYSDGTDVNIVTLNTFKAEQFGISDNEFQKLETVRISDSIFTSKESNPEFTKVWGSKSTIGGYEAYVVNAISKSGKYISTWIFKSSDGKFRYVALEGTPETLKNLLPMIEESWTIQK